MPLLSTLSAVGSGAHPACALRSAGTRCGNIFAGLAHACRLSMARLCTRLLPRRSVALPPLPPLPLSWEAAQRTHRVTVFSYFYHACGAIHEQQRASCGLGSRSGTALDQCARRRRVQGHQWPGSAVQKHAVTAKPLAVSPTASAMADRGRQRSMALREVGVAVWTAKWLAWGCWEPGGAGWPQPQPPPSPPPECLPKVSCSRLLPPQVFDMFDQDGKPA